ncbi:MAG: hypothetical protein WA777_18050 [Rhodanobacter sp.]
MTPPPAANEPMTLPFDGRSDLATIRLQLLAEARYRLAIHLPVLPGDSYASEDELTELRRIATSGRHAEIRILLHEPAAALRSSHRLVALAQRLPSTVLIRKPLEEQDLACTSAWLLTDAGGYLLLPDAHRPQGRAAYCDRAAQAPLQQQFDDIWERSVRASELQPLDL